MFRVDLEGGVEVVQRLVVRTQVRVSHPPVAEGLGGPYRLILGPFLDEVPKR